MKKRMIAIVLAAVMVVSMCSALVVSASETPTLEELFERILGLEERVDELEAGAASEIEVSSEQIAEDLTAQVWIGTQFDQSFRLTFKSDNTVDINVKYDDGETWDEEYNWTISGDVILLEDEGIYWTAEYNKTNSGSKLALYDDVNDETVYFYPTAE